MVNILMVIEKNGLFFIGRKQATTNGIMIPGIRESRTYDTKEAAGDDLKNGTFRTRHNNSLMEAYDSGALPDLRNIDILITEVEKATGNKPDKNKILQNPGRF